MRVIFLAGFFDERRQLIPIRAAIRQMGFSCRSTWIDEEDGNLHLVDQWRRYARRDERQIRAADLLIQDTSFISPRGGAMVEYGFARGIGKETWVVGPQRSVFHFLCDAHFDSWTGALAALAAHRKGITHGRGITL